MSKPPRRTQEARSAEMRRRLLDAALDCLHDIGFAKTSVSRIVERAGVSRGAFVHHFPSKLDLFSAAGEHLTRQTMKRVDTLLRSLPRMQSRVDAMMDFLWHELSQGHLGNITMELMVAARGDPQLLERLKPVNTKRQQKMDEGWQLFFETTPEVGERVPVEMMMNITTWLLRGMALDAAVSDKPESYYQAHLDLCKHLLRNMVQSKPGEASADQDDP